MLRRLVILVTIAVVLLSLTAVQAAGTTPKPPPNPTNGYIYDGRLNGADVSAPVAVFYKYDKVRVASDKPWLYAFKEIKELRGVELLAIDPKTNNGKLVLEVSAADIAKIVDKAGHEDGTLIAEKNGYAMYFAKNNWFWITTPADTSGKVYTFQWQNLTVPHD